MNALPTLLSKVPAAPAVASAPASLFDVVRVGHEDFSELIRLCDAQRAECGDRGELDDSARMELAETLFDAPFRAWAWVARRHGAAIGYALTAVGYSPLEGGYYLRLEAMHVELPWRHRGVELQLLESARELAARLGCVNLQWQDGAHVPRLAPLGARYRHAAAHVLSLESAASMVG